MEGSGDDCGIQIMGDFIKYVPEGKANLGRINWMVSRSCGIRIIVMGRDYYYYFRIRPSIRRMFSFGTFKIRNWFNNFDVPLKETNT